MLVEQAVQRAEAIFRFTEEVDRRLAEHGIAGVSDLFRTYSQFREAIGRLDARELASAVGEAERLRGLLVQIRDQITHLSALKASFEVRH
ncbi:MAG: hypothetical protein FJ144_00870 [Deltaproteobacteria bacterium]|nr:hypothetical protein [Deltaproteobacteria bacterium]